MIPRHNPVGIKTLSSILKSVSAHHGMSVEELITYLGL